MRPLRRAGLWIAIGWLLVAGLVMASLVTIPEAAIGLSSMDKLAHLGAYLLVMAWFVQIWSAWRTLLAHCCFLSALGCVLEVFQGASGHRSPDALDALANLAGVLLGWLTSRTPLAGLLLRVESRLGSRSP